MNPLLCRGGDIVVSTNCIKLQQLQWGVGLLEHLLLLYVL